MVKLAVKIKLTNALSLNKGFGLVEVIVAMVIISSITAGYFSFNAQNAKSSEYIGLKFKTLLMASTLAHEANIFGIKTSFEKELEGTTYSQVFEKNGKKSYKVKSVVKIKNTSNKINTYIYEK